MKQKKLFIYKVERDDYGYDDFIGFIVSAKTAVNAKKVIAKQYFRAYDGWNPNSDNIKVKKLGTADYKTERILFESFNAG